MLYNRTIALWWYLIQIVRDNPLLYPRSSKRGRVCKICQEDNWKLTQEVKAVLLQLPVGSSSLIVSPVLGGCLRRYPWRRGRVCCSSGCSWGPVARCQLKHVNLFLPWAVSKFTRQLKMIYIKIIKERCYLNKNLASKMTYLATRNTRNFSYRSHRSTCGWPQVWCQCSL